MPALKDIELSEEQSEELEQLDISEDEVSDCISEKIDEGMDQDQAIAACLDMAESGSTEPTESDSKDTLSMQERLQMARENPDKVRRKFIDGKDVDVVKNSDGKVTLNVPIQALTEDRDEDFINEQGQESIIRQLKSGTVGMFPNHGIGEGAAMYDFRDLFGKFVDGDNRNGSTIGTSVMREAVESDELHAHAKELVNLLEQDMPVGFSVGFIPKDVEERENGGKEISDLDLMEVSAVGIPSNPDAMPAAMSNNAIAMAKSAMERGKSPEEVAKNFEKMVKDTMSEEPNEKDGTTNESPDNEGDTKKPEEQSDKQFSDDEIQEILGVVGGALSAHMDEALQQIEAELQGEEDTEEDEMDDEDEEEEEDTVETDNEETEEDGAETDSEEVEEEKETGQEESEGLSDEEKTSEESGSGRKMNTLEEDSEEEESETEKSEEENDPAKVEQPSAYWG